MRVANVQPCALWFLLMLLCPPLWAKQATLNIYNSDHYVLTDYLSFYEDTSANLDIDTIRSADFQANFSDLPNRYLSFGVTRSALWFKIQLHYPTGAPNFEARKTLFYEVAKHHLSVSELYIVRANGEIEAIRADARTPYTQRPLANAHSIFPLTLSLGEEVTLYLHVRNDAGTYLPQNLWTPSGLAKRVANDEFIFGVLYGSIFIILIYNLLLFLTSRNKNYLYYFLFVGSALIFEFIDLGHGFGLFKDHLFFLDKQYISFFYWILWISGANYVQKFLEVKKYHPALNTGINAFQVLNLLFIPIGLYYNYLSTMMYITYFGAAMVFGVLILVLYMRYKGSRNAEFFAYAWSINMFGFSSYGFASAGLIPPTALTMFSMPFGTMMEAVVLSLALADSIKRAEKDNVDANQRAVRNLALYRSVFDNAAEGLYQMSLSGRILSINRAFATMLGYANPALAMKQRNAVSLQIIPDPEKALELLHQNSSLSRQLNLIDSEKNALPVLHDFSLTRDTDGTPLRIEGRVIDLSERKRREQVQKERSKGRREKELARKITQNKSEFLRSMNHEIRTPLHYVIGFSESLRENILSPQEKQYAIRLIAANAQHLLGLINNILDYSKIDANRLELEKGRISITSLAAHPSECLAHLPPDSDFQFDAKLTSPVPAEVAGDPGRIQQVLILLYQYILAHSGKHRIMLNIGWNQDHQLLHLQLVFNETKESLEALQHLQKDLSSKHSAQVPEEIGLAIAFRLIHLMGGQVTIKAQQSSPLDHPSQEPSTHIISDTVPELRQGVQEISISLSIPAEMQEASGWLKTLSQLSNASSKNSPENSLLQGHVLLAEDNPVNQKLVRRIIEKTGAKVTIANNGVEALQHAESKNFELVLMDINMPMMDGIEATKRLRAAGYQGSIFALTAESGSEEIRLCKEAGCNGYLQKPLELAKFNQVLRKALSISPPLPETNVTSPEHEPPPS
ncbi:Hypothetical protein HDN1F_20680 [gamma proteobacterium HdN1]|nr:Hypothetical protein HDN1F_20680 [gamma proteobacterium HdN1]